MMLHDTPLRNRHLRWAQTLVDSDRPAAVADRPGAATGHGPETPELSYLPYGPADEQGQPSCEIVERYGAIEAEYAAVRRSVGLIDAPHRGTLRVTGGERIDFLDRMVTNELKDLGANVARPTFWLNRKGRIESDLVLVELGDLMLIDVDIHQAATTVETLSSFLFAEDVEITDASGELHHLAAHGQMALDLVRRSGDGELLAPNEARRVTIADHPVTVFRYDVTGEPGLELIVPRDGAEAVWDELLDAGAAEPGRPPRVRPVGWHAFNIARIEAGTPLFNVDFGVNNVPHETGVLDDRVSFTKGCYLGQEVVARMQSLGRPKQVLVGLKLGVDRLPVSGGQVFASSDDALGDPIGAVTSSTLSPMLGATPIAFAMVRTKYSEIGTTLIVNAEGEQVEATVHDLRFWPEKNESPST